MEDLCGTADLERLLVAFYQRVGTDALLAPFFAGVAMDHHIPRIVAFWDSLLFGTGRYQGDVMGAHTRLHARHPLRGEHFQRWLALFDATVDAGFAGPKAEEAKARARSIAGVMAHRVTTP